MGTNPTNEVAWATNTDLDSKLSERRAFDDTKAGVKGLVDAGVKKIPTLFHHHPEKFEKTSGNHVIPVIDFANIDTDPSIHQEIVDQLREASETWGFFQVVNHGIPLSVLEEIKYGVQRFFEQDVEVTKGFYTRDKFKSFIYNSNFDLYSSPALNWRDTFLCYLAPDTPKPEDWPEVCRDILLEYGKHMMNMGTLLFEFLSEALGLNPNHLKDIGCTDGLVAICNYYPACPEPQFTVGNAKHSDADFLTVLVQDNIGGLQVLYQDQWIDVTPVPEALVVNVGDLLQLITNDRFKSVEHRVLANHVGPRISAAYFFSTGHRSSSKLYAPLKELLSKDDPPKYRETTVADYTVYFEKKGMDGISALTHYKI